MDLRRRSRPHVRLCGGHPAALFAHRAAAAGHAGRDRRRGDGRRLRIGAGLRSAHRGERSQSRPAGSPARPDPRRRRHAAADPALRPGARQAIDPRRGNARRRHGRRAWRGALGGAARRAPAARGRNRQTHRRPAAGGARRQQGLYRRGLQARPRRLSPTNWNSPGRCSPMPKRGNALRRFLRARPKPRHRRKKGRHDDIRWQGSFGHRRRLRHRQGDGDGVRPPGRDGDLRRRERRGRRGVEAGSRRRQREGRFRRHRSWATPTRSAPPPPRC